MKKTKLSLKELVLKQVCVHRDESGIFVLTYSQWIIRDKYRFYGWKPLAKGGWRV